MENHYWKLILSVFLTVIISFSCGERDSQTESLSTRSYALSDEERGRALAQGAEDELKNLERLVASRYAEYLASLSATEKTQEESMADESGVSGSRLFVEWSRHGVVRSLWAWRMRIPTATPVNTLASEKAHHFLDSYPGLFGISTPSASLTVSRMEPSSTGATIIRFKQELHNLPVFNSNLMVHVGVEGDIEWLVGVVVPESCAKPEVPLVSKEDAAASVNGDSSTAVLGWFDPEALGLPATPIEEVRLAWKIRATEVDEDYDVYVDAATGEELYRKSLVYKDEHKEIFYCNNCSPSQLPGTLIYDDVCHTSGDAECPSGKCYGGYYCFTGWQGTALTIYASTNETHDYYKYAHSRDSWDDGQCGDPGHSCTDSNLHRMRASSDTSGGSGSYCGAWHSYESSTATAQIETISTCACPNIVAHEFTHGITESEEAIGYSTCNASSVLNEAFSDVFGELMQDYYESDPIDWETGSNCTGSATRSLEDPPNKNNICDPGYACGGNQQNKPNPDHYSNWRPECGQHWNSTVISKIGYLMGRKSSEGSETHWGIPVTGIGDTNAGKAWYKTLTELLTDPATFSEFRDSMFTACNQLFTGSTYSNCIYATIATGLWTNDANAGVNADKVIALNTFSVNGQSRRWMFHKSYDTSNYLQYRYRTCTIYGSCSWSSPVWMDSTSDGPSSAIYNGTLYVCFRSTSGYNWCDRITSSGSKLYGPDPGGTLVGPPSLVFFNDALYLAYRKSNGTIYWRKYTTSSGWSSEASIGSSNHPPVLASADEDMFGGGDELWVVYSKTTNSRIVYRKFNTGTNTWGSEMYAGNSDEEPKTPGRPSASMYRDRLHVANREFLMGTQIEYMSCEMPCDSRDDWTRHSGQEGTMQGDIILDNYGARDGRLYLWRRPWGSDALKWRYKQSK